MRYNISLCIWSILQMLIVDNIKINETKNLLLHKVAHETCSYLFVERKVLYKKDTSLIECLSCQTSKISSSFLTQWVVKLILICKKGHCGKYLQIFFPLVTFELNSFLCFYSSFNHILIQFHFHWEQTTHPYIGT